MKKENVYYIYLTTNKVNGKKYIGQHYGPIDDSYLGSGTLLKEAINNYGRDAFSKTILEICFDYDSMNKAEREWIAKYNAVQDNNFYNLAEGGYGSNPVAGRTKQQEQERRQKISMALRGTKNPAYGTHPTGPMKGKHHTEEAKLKMRQAKIGEKSPTARKVAIYDLQGNFIRQFGTQRELKIFLGLSPNGSTDTLKKYIASQKPYHGYIVKYI